jgi:hypothetical protein
MFSLVIQLILVTFQQIRAPLYKIKCSFDEIEADMVVEDFVE